MNENIYNELTNLYDSKTIPNIILYGKNLTGKKTILLKLLEYIYKSEENISKYTLIINCSHGKGNIKYIRENLKFFANSITENNKFLFKSIVLINADKLTMDAQSALRRCIEIYNNNSRFFIIVEDKSKLIKPIISRFSHIYCNKVIKINNNHKIYLNNKYNKFKNYIIKQIDDFKKSSLEDREKNLVFTILKLTEVLYNNGYSANHILQYINSNIEDDINKLKFCIYYEKHKIEIKNEKILIFINLAFLFIRFNIDLENIHLI